MVYWKALDAEIPRMFRRTHCGQRQLSRRRATGFLCFTERFLRGAVSPFSGKKSLGGPSSSRLAAAVLTAIRKSLYITLSFFSEGYCITEGEIYVGIEHPKGEFGAYIESDGSNKSYRLKTRAPGFANNSAMDELIIRTYISR